MTSSLSSDQINVLETLIKNNKPSYLSMSYNTLYEAKKKYEKIKEEKITSYMIFSCENYTTYALYKSVKGQTYIVTTYMQTPNEYCSLDMLV